RARQDLAPQGRVPPGLRAWHASEPLRPTWPLPLLPRPHLEYDVARRRRLPTRRRSDRTARQQGNPTAALHDRKQRLIPTSNPSGEDSSEVEGCDHSRVVGTRFALAGFRVIFDLWHPRGRGDGRDVGDAGARDEKVADEDVVDQFNPAPVET